MYETMLQPVSNRADWTGSFAMIDDETEDVITDVDGLSISMTVRDRRTHCPVISASSENGLIVYDGQGVFSWSVPRSQMTAICAGSYEIGITISRDNQTSQMLVGTLPIVNGVVSR